MVYNMIGETKIIFLFKKMLNDHKVCFTIFTVV